MTTSLRFLPLLPVAKVLAMGQLAQAVKNLQHRKEALPSQQPQLQLTRSLFLQLPSSQHLHLSRIQPSSSQYRQVKLSRSQQLLQSLQLRKLVAVTKLQQELSQLVRKLVMVPKSQVSECTQRGASDHETARMK